jgi:hypothetical protein
MEFDEAIEGGEGLAVDLKAIAAERKIASGELPGIVGGKRTVELESVVGKINRGFERETVWAGDFEVKLAGVALGNHGKCEEREREEQDTEVE